MSGRTRATPAPLRTQAGEPAVTVPEAARRLGITAAAAYLAIQERRLRASIETVQATRVLVPLAALRAFRPDVSRQRGGRARQTARRAQDRGTGRPASRTRA